MPELDEPEVPELPEDAAGDEDDLDLWVFLWCFLVFFFGVCSVVVVSVLAPALDEAAGWAELAPEVSPRMRLPLVLLPGIVLPAAPLPMVPEAPEVSLLEDGVLGAVDEPEEPLPMVPEAPEVPDVSLLEDG